MNTTKKKTASSLLWWQVDEEQISKEVENYKTLSIFSSSRGASIGCIIFTALLTTAFVIWGGYDVYSFVDVGLFLFLGIFIYLGHRWAIILAMIYWTFAKGFSIFEAFSVSPTKTFAVYLSVLWWALYMGVFYKAYLVENLRKKKPHSPIVN